MMQCGVLHVYNLIHMWYDILRSVSIITMRCLRVSVRGMGRGRGSTMDALSQAWHNFIVL